MILVESDEYLFNFSNAHVIIFENQEISVYYNSNNIMKIQGYETVDTSDFWIFFQIWNKWKNMYQSFLFFI